MKEIEEKLDQELKSRYLKLVEEVNEEVVEALVFNFPSRNFEDYIQTFESCLPFLKGFNNYEATGFSILAKKKAEDGVDLIKDYLEMVKITREKEVDQTILVFSGAYWFPKLLKLVILKKESQILKYVVKAVIELETASHIYTMEAEIFGGKKPRSVGEFLDLLTRNYERIEKEEEPYKAIRELMFE